MEQNLSHPGTDLSRRRFVQGSLLAALAAGAGLPMLVVHEALAQQRAWYPSKWGPADEVGAANEITPAKTLDALKLVKRGKAYALGVEVHDGVPAFPPRFWKMYIVQPGQQTGLTLGVTKTTYNEEVVMGGFGVGTQIDGLGHVGIDGRYYNGLHAKDFAPPTGLTKLGIEKVPPIVTRGVLLDIAGLKGVPMMKEGEVITVADIEAAMQGQRLSIGKGDVVIFNTGWLAALWMKDNARFGKAEPGIGVKAAEYLAAKGVAMVGADTWGLEVLPFEVADRVFEVHQILLAQNGTYILENIVTADLVRDGVSEFLFVLGVPRFKGAVQAIINPLAVT